MTTIEQALHIFRKDARHLRFEIAGMAVLLVVLILTGVQSWEGIQERGYWRGTDEEPLSLLLALSWSLLIARVIQTEALPGDRHFWLTRPYSRTGLVLSKALFIAAFISAPLLLVQSLIIWLDGLPLLSHLGGLLWNQVLLAVLFLLPIAAIAALTRNLAQFLPIAVLTGALLVGPIAEARSFGDLQWIRLLVGLALAAAITVFVLWRQYRLRRSVNTALRAVAVTVVAVILYHVFPPSLAFAIQSGLTGSAEEAFALRLAPAEPRKPDTTTPNRYRQLVTLPITVVGAAPRDLRVRSSLMTFKTLAGITREPRSRLSVTDQHLVQTVSLDRTFFDAAKNSPVTVRGEFYLTQFGNAESTQVSMDGTPVYIPGLGQCGVLAGYDHRQFLCRSAFRAPQPFVSERVASEGGDYSLFAAIPRVYPVIGRMYELVGANQEIAPAAPEAPATLIVREPVAYFRYTMEAPNVRLGEYATAEPDEGEEN